MTPLLSRLRERKVVQWALAYLAGAWLLLQVLKLLHDTYAWPPVIMRSAPVVLAIGFFAALVIAWYHGEKGRQRVSGPELLMLSGILLVAGVGVFSWVASPGLMSAARPPLLHPARPPCAPTLPPRRARSRCCR